MSDIEKAWNEYKKTSMPLESLPDVMDVLQKHLPNYTSTQAFLESLFQIALEEAKPPTVCGNCRYSALNQISDICCYKDKRYARSPYSAACDDYVQFLSAEEKHVLQVYKDFMSISFLGHLEDAINLLPHSYVEVRGFLKALLRVRAEKIVCSGV